MAKLKKAKSYIQYLEENKKNKINDHLQELDLNKVESNFKYMKKHYR